MTSGMPSRPIRASRTLVACSVFLFAAVSVPGSAYAAKLYRDAVLDTGPVAYWGLGDTTGPAVDRVAGRNGVYVAGSAGSLERGARGVRIAGKWDEAVSIRDESNLDGGGGSGGYVATSLPSGVWEGRRAFSVNLWLRWDGPRYWRGAPATEGILGNKMGAPYFLGWSLYLPGGVGSGRLNVFRDASQAGIVAPDRLQEGRWTMVTVTYDGSVLRLYQDGEQVGSRLDSAYLSGSASMSVGRQDFNNFLSGYYAYFNGAIDEVSVWSRGLSAAEIRSFYRKPFEAAPAVLVFVPGIAGSELELDRAGLPNLDLWPDSLFKFWLRDELETAEDGVTSLSDVKASRILASAYGDPLYGDAIRTFEGWEQSGTLADFVPFPYDWRLGVRFAADRLADAISERCGRAPIWLAGHSTGGLVVKRALRLLRDRGIDVEACLGRGGVFFLGTPHAGAPKAIGAVINPDLFFADNFKRRVIPQRPLARLINDWLSAWQLIPRPSGAGVPTAAREPWFDDPDDGRGDRNVAGGLLNWALDRKADEADPYQQSLAGSTGSLPVYNVFGYSGLTEGSYAPGRCELSKTGQRVYRELDRNTSVDKVVRGDSTVPGWSAVWSGSGLEERSQYGLANVRHNALAGDPRVTALMLRAITDANPALYPPWPLTAGGALRGAAAVAAALADPKPARTTSLCSPALLLAAVNGGQIGQTDVDSVVNEVPDALVSVGLEEDDRTQQTLVIPESDDGAVPTYRVTAIADGPVSIWHTEPDGATYDFRISLATGDVAELRGGGGAWALRVDRSGDGTVDAIVPANAPQVEIDSVPPAREGDTLQLGLVAGSPAGDALAFAWEVLEGDAVVREAGATAQLTVNDGPQTVRVRVTATDEHGRTGSDDVSVQVANAPPAADAGPPVSTPWGLAATLRGAGSDPGPSDRTTLAFAWEFGDGSLGEAAVVEHVWSEPGAYEARLTVRDRDGAAASSSTTVTVSRRAAGLTGSWPPTALFGFRSLTASLADRTDAGTARLSGRAISFSAGGSSHVADTALGGRAEAVLALPLASGTHTVEAALRGDRLYDDASAAGTLTILNSTGKLTGEVKGETVKAELSVHSDERGVRGNVQLKLGTESLHLSELSSFGAADGTIWIAGTTRAGRELLLRIVHTGREPARVSVWSERTSVADEPASGELQLR